MKKLLTIFVLLSFLGCYEPTEGCLDTNATNFDVTADRSCDGCCKYPDLKLKVEHKIIPVDNLDTVLSFSYGTLHRVFPDTTHFFKVEKISFLLSNIHLITESGDEIGVKGKLTLQTPIGGLEIENNFAKINAGSSSEIVIGKMENTGTFTKVKFLFGITDDVNVANPAAMPDGHPLDIKSDSTNWALGDGYISNSIDFKRDTAAMTPVTQIDLFQAHEIVLNLPEAVSIAKGHNVKITFSVNYLKWFSGVDFVNDTDEIIAQKLNENSPNSFFNTTVQ